MRRIVLAIIAIAQVSILTSSNRASADETVPVTRGPSVVPPPPPPPLGPLAVLKSFVYPSRKSCKWFVMETASMELAPTAMTLGSGYGVGAVGRF